jgi:short-subunit dehydrogenase
MTMTFHYLAELSNLVIFFLVTLSLFTCSLFWLLFAAALFATVHFNHVQLHLTNCKAKRGETALVTGASRGIGSEIAKVLASFGYNLVLVGRNEQNLIKVASECTSINKDIKVEVVVLDLAVDGAPQLLYEHCTTKNVHIDYLINNAGLGLCDSIAETDFAEVTRMLHLNVVALTQLTHLFLPSMIKNKTGGILNIGSVAGEVPTPRFAIYGATKTYVRNFTASLWWECRSTGVKVSLCEPGGVATEFIPRSKYDTTWWAKWGVGRDVHFVAEIAVKGLMSDQMIVIPRALNVILVYASSFLPHVLNLWFVNWLHRKVRNDKEH